MQVRLQKILSAAGVASRRAAERLILEGRVSVNGQVVRELGTRADPERDEIRFDDRRVKTTERHRYFLLNKPRGYVTTRSDPQGRPTVMHLLKGVREYVYPVGRLDYGSEGLLILTNDGDLAARLTHPRHEVERVYEVRVLGVPDAHDLDRLRRGVTIDGRRTAPAEVTLVPEGRSRGSALHLAERVSTAKRDNNAPAARFPRRGPALRTERASQALLRITIHEGRTRQVRKMFDAIGHPVRELRRIRIGPITDAGLKAGAFRELTNREVESLQKAGKP